jgi:hypothetical protein
MKKVLINVSPAAYRTLLEGARAHHRSASEQISWVRAKIERLRALIAECNGFPPTATRDYAFQSDFRWFECEPAFLVLASLVKVIVGRKMLFLPITELHVTIIEINWSPDIRLRAT